MNDLAGIIPAQKTTQPLLGEYQKIYRNNLIALDARMTDFGLESRLVILQDTKFSYILEELMLNLKISGKINFLMEGPEGVISGIYRSGSQELTRSMVSRGEEYTFVAAVTGTENKMIEGGNLATSQKAVLDSHKFLPLDSALFLSGAIAYNLGNGAVGVGDVGDLTQGLSIRTSAHCFALDRARGRLYYQTLDSNNTYFAKDIYAAGLVSWKRASKDG